jgi:hypothetical protein
VLVLIKQSEIRIGTLDLLGKGRANALGLGGGEATLAGAEGHQGKLVVFAALET